MRLKRHIKEISGRVCGSPLLQPILSSKLRDCVNVVYYHFVGESEPHYEAFHSGCSLARFKQDLGHLSRVFDIVSLADVISGSPFSDSPGRPTVAITFDDGFDLFRTGVVDVLAQYGIRATTFLITSCIDNRTLMWRHKLSVIRSLVPERKCVTEYNFIADEAGLPRIGSANELMEATTHWDMSVKDALAAELWERCHLPPESEYLLTHKPYFDWEGLRRWIDAGHSVGFHTHTHPFCSRLTRTDLRGELIEPAINLKKKLGLTQLCLSYPFGDRLPEDLENDLFSERVFTAFFGIDGFRKKGTSYQWLERVGVEQDGICWPVFARSLLRGVA